MAFAGKDSGEEKQTGYTFRGKPIILSKTRGRPPSGKLSSNGNGFWHENKRIEALTVFAATGNFSEVERLTGVPKDRIKLWVKEPWAKDLLEEIRSENDAEIDAKFSKIAQGALDQIIDRLENGDAVLRIDGSVQRKPIGARDLSMISSSIIDKRQLLRGKPTSRTESISEGSRLKKLEAAFTKLAHTKRPKPVEISDVEFTEVTRDDEDQSGQLGGTAANDPAQGLTNQ